MYIYVHVYYIYATYILLTSIDKSKQKSEADNVCERIYNVIKVHVYVCERKKKCCNSIIFQNAHDLVMFLVSYFSL